MCEEDSSLQDPEYIGDGVYASHDGYQVWLAVNGHTNNVVALEPLVLKALVRYAQRHKMIPNDPD